MIAVFAAAALSVVSAKSTGFDARAIYGLKARLLYDAGSISTEDFQDVDRMHFNAHYPLLIPLHEAALFNLQQSTSDRFHRIFFFAFIVALGSAMAREFRRMFSRQLSALFTAGLICLPSILLTWEGAGLTGAVDFPLACFATAGVLATMRWVRMQDSRQALLAGAMFGAAVLTKSEGMLWVGAAGTAMLALVILRRVPVDRTTWKHGWAGACLLLMVIVVYRAVREQIPYSPHLRSYAAALHWDWLRQLWARPFQVAWYGLRDSVRPKYWNFAWVCVAAALVLRR
jgi:hypothetical protein